MADLNKICIRAEVGGKWMSPTLQELHDMGEGGMVFEWAINRLNGMDAVNITPEGLSLLVDAMEALGVPIVKLK